MCEKMELGGTAGEGEETKRGREKKFEKGVTKKLVCGTECLKNEEKRRARPGV